MVKGAEIIQENLSQMKLALKESKKSIDGKIDKSRSSGTKFFSSFQHKSMGEGADPGSSFDSNFSLFKPQKNDPNIEVVQFKNLNKTNSINELQKKSLHSSGTLDSLVHKSRAEQLEKYQKLTSFIDQMFKKKDKTNPV